MLLDSAFDGSKSFTNMPLKTVEVFFDQIKTVEVKIEEYMEV